MGALAVVEGEPAGGPPRDIDHHKFTVTFFLDQAARVKIPIENATLPQLAELIRRTTEPSKMALPWLKLASFGEKRSAAGCLRTNDNLIEISGVEGDHDSGELSFDAAVEIMRKAKVRCLLYTSASFVPGTKERWRVIAPLSKNYAPKHRREFVAYLNGLLGGKLAGESFTLSLSYLFGSLNDNPHHRVEVLDGDFLDHRQSDLLARAIFKDGSVGLDGLTGKRPQPARTKRNASEPVDRRKVEAALAAFSSNCSYEVWLKVAGALHDAFGEDGFDLFDDWSAKATGAAKDGTPMYSYEKSLERWAGARTMEKVSVATIFYYADQADPTWRARYEAAERQRVWEALSGGIRAMGGDAGGSEDADTSEFVAEHADPVDLWAKFDPPSLPRGLLPRVIEDFAVDRSKTMGCDISGIAVGALAVCAGAIPDSIKLQPKRNDTEWLESARLWVLQIGDPSTMKTPSIQAATKPSRRINSEMAHEYQRAMDAWSLLQKDEQRHTRKPKKLRAMIFDTTIESTQEILRDSPNGVLLEDDELSGWFDAMYKYSGARGAQKDRSFWLQAYNGGSKTVDRITRGTVHIDNLSVSIIGGSQPGPIRKLADAGEDDGLLQRFLPIMVRPAVGGRDEPPGWAVLDYEKMVRKLFTLEPATRLLEHILRVDTPLKFDDGALKIREELERKHLDLMLLEGLNRKLTSHFGKYNGMFARLCLVWHCVEHAAGGVGELPAVVTEATARRVADFLHGFLKPHAVAFYVGVLGLSNDHDRLANVADYVLAHKLERNTNRDVARGDRSMRGLKKHETEAIFEQLEALGWIIRTPGSRPSDPPHWIVNPVVHQRFAERAEAAKKRREQDRKMIGELLKSDRA
jgi:hypothetical protein